MATAMAETKSLSAVAGPARRRVAQLRLHHAPAYLVVDAGTGRVTFLEGVVGPFLAPSDGTASLMLFSLLRDGLQDPTRAALRQAEESRQAASRHVRMPHDGTAALTILVEPLYPAGDPLPGDDAEACLFIVAFYPQPGGMPPARDEGVRGGGRSDGRGRPGAWDGEAWRKAGAGVRQPPGSGRGGEAAMPVEALHDEVDELRALNAELSAANDRLVRLNEDFGTLLDSTLIATMFLDRELRVRSFTSNMTELFALRGADVGRCITDLSSRLDYAELEADVARALDTLQLVEREVQDLGPVPRVLLMRMRPHSRPDDAPDGVVLSFVDITGRKRAENQAWFLAHHDPLTGLPNRAMFHTMLEQGDGSAARGEVGLLYLDLDLFKTVNDTFGHRVGDRLLQMVAARLLECVPEGAVVCRQGGDEFAIVQNDVPDPEGLVALARAITTAVSAPYEIDRHVVQIGVSVGIASAAGERLDVDALTRAADLALYDAKAQGRGMHSVFRPGMEVEWQRRRRLEIDLREAVAEGQLALVYQPIVRVADRRITGAEALIRWHHPRHGLLAPASFIPIAEETGLIAAIGDWALQTACRDAARWPEPICLSVNLSSVQFASLDLIDTVRDALDASGLAPERLALEVTETVLLHDNVRTQTVLAALRRAGVSIAMDDFGTGYSSLSYLRDFAVQKIKIDQAFIRTIDSQHASSIIVKAILTIGIGLDIEICAEGVETESQLDALQQWGVREVQGFLLHRPMSSARLDRLLAEGGGA